MIGNVTTIGKCCFALAAAGLSFAAQGAAQAQMPQIPTIQTCTPRATATADGATVKIDSRADSVSGGVFTLVFKITCNPTTGYPTGTVQIKVDMSDSTVKGEVISTALHQLAATGKHTPTAYASGWCKAEGVVGCRFWLMVADNNAAGETRDRDIASFLILDANGHRMAYGTGPVISGKINVKPAP
ncbi:MAG: hypothetical protein OEY16_10215 [Alphaproteobacteria bacterium]|nr:hypothetical protein [Alphaproteobacteria bacterium]